MKTAYFLCSWVAATLSLPILAAEPDRVLSDFEGADYAGWKVEGTAFGTAPAHGTLPGQMPVKGYLGQGLANSFSGGDGSRGKLTSPEFPIDRKYIAFLVGGGGWEGKTCMNLLVDGTVVRTVAGPNTEPGGTEDLAPSGWDVADLAGKMAHLEIIDDATGGWGHINVDQIALTDTKPPIAPRILSNASREITISKRWLSFPVKNGAKSRVVTVSAGGKVVRPLEMELADGPAEWLAPLDVSAWRGQSLTVTVKRLPENSRALEQITQSDEYPGADGMYRETMRPQFHFSARRGWLNDPNGMAFFRGEYHLFFQHSPFSWDGSLKHWGQAVSRDLVHWEEIGDQLDPDELGSMWSGSGVVDWKNTSGFGKDGQPPLVLTYTAAGPTFTQCLASTTDGRKVTKFPGNPVLRQITNGNRDPKVMWHEPTQRWVMVLYVEQPARRHTVHFFTSPNLRDWTLASIAEGGTGDDNFLFECPDFFELPIDGDPSRKKWILAAANTEYQVGTFDGQKFTPETTKLPGERGRGFYAPQTFSDEPKDRRIQIGWMRTASREMPFNQSMSIPLELGLAATPEGPRLTYSPVPELQTLRSKSHSIGAVTLAAGAANPLAQIQGELFEIVAEFEADASTQLQWNIRGATVSFDGARQEVTVNAVHAPAPIRKGRQQLTLFVDRTSVELFTSGGLTYVPLPVNLKAEERSISVAAEKSPVKFSRLDVHELQSAWLR